MNTAATGAGAVVVLALVLAAPGRVAMGDASAATSPAQAAVSSDDPSTVAPPARDGGLTVFLVTFGPGREIWERFGHNAIWIRNGLEHTDVAYHYGLFDFNQQDFIVRFLRGRMLYSMGVSTARELIATYATAGRSIWVQEINLTAKQALDVQQFLEWNARPENRVYRYDYYADNCSTRIRDALDAVLTGEIHRQLAGVVTESTYRSETFRYTASDILLSTGLLLALGQPADRPLSAWEAAFIPMELQAQLRRVHVSGPDGTSISLVRSERALTLAQAASPPVSPSRRVPLYLLVGVLTGGVIVALGTRARLPASTVARSSFAVVGALWGLLVGTLGLVILGLWGLTEHVATYWNENLLQVNPLSLTLAMAAPMAVRPRRRFTTLVCRLGLLPATLAVFGAIAQALPSYDQANGAIVALALPIHCAVAWSLLPAARGQA